MRSLLSATVGVSQLREMVMAGLAVAGLTQLGARQLSRLKAVRMTQGFDQTLRVWAKSELPGFFWESVGFPLRFSRRWARFPAKLLETCFFKPPKFPKKLLETLTQGKALKAAAAALASGASRSCSGSGPRSPSPSAPPRLPAPLLIRIN